MMNKKQLLKYLKNDMNSFEKRKTIEWIRKDAENHKVFNILKAEYIASNFKDSPADKKVVFFDEFKSRFKKIQPYLYIAVSAVIVFLWSVYTVDSDKSSSGKVIQLNGIMAQDVSFVTDRGAKKEIYLPDGSRVVLNADSKLTYAKEFNDLIREVVLVGEAFFEIKKNLNKPFIVYTDNIDLKVLGTSFNVKSYAKDKKIETTLVSGRVELARGKAIPIVLAPSQKAIFYKKENKLEIEEVPVSDMVAWKEGKLIFNKTPLQEVVRDLERKYNITIKINSQKLLSYKYTGVFDNLTIEEVLTVLIVSSPIKYSFLNDEIILE